MNSFATWNIPKQAASSQAVDEKFDPTFTTARANLDDQDSTVDSAAYVSDVTARAVANAQRQERRLHADGSGGEDTASRLPRSHMSHVEVDAAHEQHQRQQIQQQQQAIHGLPIGPLQIQQLQIQTGHYDDIKPHHAHNDNDRDDVSSRMDGSPELLNDEAKGRGSGNRPVLTTKRAAQNRNAQRAFRQRKEKYIKELEIRAAEADELRKNLNDVRQENLQLRDYTLVLQSKVIELLGSAETRNAAARAPQDPGAQRNLAQAESAGAGSSNA